MSQTIELTPMQEQPDVPMRTSDTQEQFNVKTQNWMVAWKNNVAIWNDNLPVLNAGLNATLAVAYVLPSVERVAQSADNVDRLAQSAGNIDRVAQSADNVDTIVPHAANVDAVAGSIVSINTVAADMPAIIDAPNQALVAATSAAEALASEQAAKSSESMAKASETAAKLSETNAKTSENASKASEEEVEAIKDQLIAIAGGDVLTSANLSTDLPLALGKASAGTSTDVARADHVHPNINAPMKPTSTTWVLLTLPYTSSGGISYCKLPAGGTWSYVFIPPFLTYTYISQYDTYKYTLSATEFTLSSAPSVFSSVAAGGTTLYSMKNSPGAILGFAWRIA